MPSIFTTSIHTQFATAFCFYFSSVIWRHLLTVIIVNFSDFVVLSFLSGPHHPCFLAQTRQRSKSSTSVLDRPSRLSLLFRLIPRWQLLLLLLPTSSCHTWKPLSKHVTGRQWEDKRPCKTNMMWSSHKYLKYLKNTLIYCFISIKNDNNGFSSVIFMCMQFTSLYPLV